MSETNETGAPMSIESFADYNPILLDKEDLRKLTTLIFGINPDEQSGEDLSKRLQEDKLIVRQKYQLPQEEMLVQQPEEYYRQLESIAHREGVTIANKNEYHRFFKEHRARAVRLDSQTIPQTVALDTLQDNDTKADIKDKAGDLQHELIHVLQKKKYPGMGLARKEYEAYIADSNEDYLKTKPWSFLERVAMSIKPEQLEEEWKNYSNELTKI